MSESVSALTFSGKKLCIEYQPTDGVESYRHSRWDHWDGHIAMTDWGDLFLPAFVALFAGGFIFAGPRPVRLSRVVLGLFYGVFSTIVCYVGAIIALLMLRVFLSNMGLWK